MSAGWRDRAELFAGKHGLFALRRAFATASGLRAGTAHGVAYLFRPGQGTPVVAIHGFGGDKETWLLWAPWLARRRPLLLIDLPGHGGSRAIDDRGAGAKAQAQAVLAVMDACGLERAVICGNSMGGGIAQRLARTWPERIVGLVLVASVAHDFAESELTRELAAGRNMLMPGSGELEQFVKRMVEKPPRVPKAIQRYVASERVRLQPRLAELWAAWTAVSGDDAVPHDPEAIGQPALVIHGDRDRVIALETAQRLAARMPAARLEVLQGIGHVPQLEEPRRVARLVEAFLAQHA
ncbi:MAG: alpha/beta fold hydrolase [Deltaproteobacteria bacterium]|nr:alpha/beta fold hydrolase [Deltaproteobacteria bacterium]